MRSLPLLAVSVVAGILAGCAASADSATFDAGPDQNRDAGSDVEKGNTPVTTPAEAFGASTIMVNGFTTNALSDVVVCPTGAAPLSVALPTTGTIALTNYPGIARGRGVDLGRVDFSAGVEVYSASDVANQQDRTCGALQLKPHLHVDLTTTSLGGPSVIVLLDQAVGKAVARRIAISVKAEPVPDHVVAHFAAAPAGSVAPDLTVTGDGLSAQVGTPSASTAVVMPAHADYVVTFKDAAKFSYSQSLGSIQRVSDPTTEPGAFYSPRTQFLFILLGDPSDRYTEKLPRDVTGKELHVAAVPFELVAK